MVKIERSVFINAPVEKVFDYHTDPTNNPEYWPSFVEAKDIEDAPSGGKNFAWEYKMAGIRLEGTSEAVEYVPNERYVTKSKGGIESKFIYRYEPEGEGTRVSMEVEYVVPVPVLQKLAEAFILKINEREADAVLGNLKDRLET